MPAAPGRELRRGSIKMVDSSTRLLLWADELTPRSGHGTASTADLQKSSGLCCAALHAHRVASALRRPDVCPRSRGAS